MPIDYKQLGAAVAKASVPPTFYLVSDLIDLIKTKENYDEGKGNPQEASDMTSDILTKPVNMDIANLLKEIAIAERINNSEIVEIEEYFEGNGKGGTGVTIDGKNKSGNLGLSGEGSKITKRVYKFTGLDSSIDKIIELLEKDQKNEWHKSKTLMNIF